MKEGYNTPNGDGSNTPELPTFLFFYIFTYIRDVDRAVFLPGSLISFYNRKACSSRRSDSSLSTEKTSKTTTSNEYYEGEAFPLSWYLSFTTKIRSISSNVNNRGKERTWLFSIHNPTAERRHMHACMQSWKTDGWSKKIPLRNFLFLFTPAVQWERKRAALRRDTRTHLVS